MPPSAMRLKANSNLAVLRELSSLGAGADIVSAGELTRALKANMKPIIFSGVGKNRAELETAIHHSDVQINIESYQEFQQIVEICRQQAPNTPCRIAVRINPDIDAGTHDKISTGRKGDKFGVSFTEAVRIYSEVSKIPMLKNHAVCGAYWLTIIIAQPLPTGICKVAEFYG